MSDPSHALSDVTLGTTRMIQMQHFMVLTKLSKERHSQQKFLLNVIFLQDRLCLPLSRFSFFLVGECVMPTTIIAVEQTQGMENMSGQQIVGSSCHKKKKKRKKELNSHKSLFELYLLQQVYLPFISSHCYILSEMSLPQIYPRLKPTRQGILPV